MSRFSQLISEETKVPPALIDSALKLAHVRYRKIRVPKRSGGHRTILQPAAELKLIQAWLNERVLSHLPVSPIASAFERGSSIVKNAAIHRNSAYSIRTDLKNFIPSIRSVDLIEIIRSNSSILPRFVLEPDFSNLVSKACFDRDDRLPIGYPTSPCIANVVMYDIDSRLLNRISAETETFGKAKLTRYADDFVFSTDKAGACHSFLRALEELLAQTNSPHFELNANKTRFMSRRGGSTLVTGLRINQDGEVRVHANYRDHVRLLLKHFSSGTLKPEDVPRLTGHLAFIEHADPKLFTRLSFRYYAEIGRIRDKHTT